MEVRYTIGLGGTAEEEEDVRVVYIDAIRQDN